MYNHVPRMKMFFKAKDGGPESNVTGYWLIESKKFFSIAVLKFSKGSREAFHNHAFNAKSLVFWGKLLEEVREDGLTFIKYLVPSFKVISTPRECMHRVHGVADTSWAITVRGPWADSWNECFDKTGEWITLTSGRIVKEVRRGGN